MFDAKVLEGKNFIMAINEIAQARLQARIIVFNGVGYPFFEDYNEKRVNLWIKDNLVEKVELG